MLLRLLPRQLRALPNNALHRITLTRGFAGARVAGECER